jgi:soluble lytic murein transglycosylase-like protein
MADSGTQTPEALRRRYAMAQALMAGQKRPIQHWTQGLEDLASAGIGGYQFAKAEASDRERLANDSAALAAITGGAGPDRGNIAGTSGGADVARALGLNWPGTGPQPAMQPSAPASAAPVGNAGASPMGQLPALGSRVYDQGEFNPLDAAVATPKELAAGVPAPPQYAALVGKAAVDNDLPPQLLAAQLKQESGFNPNAVSPAGATGISQFMPATAREMGVTDPRDPTQAIPAGARYLRQNIDKFGGSVPLGLAAYNAGPGRVERSGGDISRLPAETQGYVKNITGASQSPVAAALTQPASGGILAGATPQQRAAIVAGMQASEGSPARAIAQALMQKLVTQNPLDTEAKQLDIETKKKALAAPPEIKTIETEGGKAAVQWDPNKKAYVPFRPPEGSAPANPKLTEQQSKDVGFYNRGKNLLPRLEKQDQFLTDPASAIGGQVSNYLKSDDYRQAEQTGKELLAVILRKDTGAAVTPSEMGEYGSIYLPKPGDDAATIQQKQVARQTAIEGLRMGLGPAEIIFNSREAAEAAKGAPQAPGAPSAPSFRPGGTTKSGVKWSVE